MNIIDKIRHYRSTLHRTQKQKLLKTAKTEKIIKIIFDKMTSVMYIEITKTIKRKREKTRRDEYERKREEVRNEWYP